MRKLLALAALSLLPAHAQRNLECVIVISYPLANPTTVSVAVPKAPCSEHMQQALEGVLNTMKKNPALRTPDRID